MESASINSFLGKGWGFPPTFVKGLLTVETVEGVSDIKKSLEVLLTTNFGERTLQPDYGCGIFFAQFDTTGPVMQNEMTEMVRTAIEKFEPRVKLDNIHLVPTELEGKIEIHVDYTIVQSNTEGNLVFPFYMNNGKILL